MRTVFSTEYVLFNLLSFRDSVTSTLFNEYLSSLCREMPNVILDVSDDALTYVGYLYKDRIHVGYSDIALASGTTSNDIRDLVEASYNWLYTPEHTNTVRKIAESIATSA